MRLIDKDVIITEIERLRKNNEPKEDKDYAQFELDVSCGYNMALDDIKTFIDNLEVKELPIWEKVSPDTGQTTLYLDGDKSYLERFGYRIDLKDLDKLPKENLKVQKGEVV